MARWILKCDNCNFEFTHSMITDQSAESYFLPKKPVFADVEIECPNCGNSGSTSKACYKISDSYIFDACRYS
jgi:predicted RNA-binding Zn-ribbon protein involved in translation (DUF1610 family)